MRAALIIILLLGSLAWIAYAGFSLVEKERYSYHPEFVFNAEDSAVLVVNHWSELEGAHQLLPAKNPYLQIDIPAQFADLKYYFSANRPFFIVQQKGKWSKSQLEKFTQQFMLTNDEVNYHNGDFVLVSKKNLELNEAKGDFLTLNDKNATASLVDFISGANTDVYRTPQGNYRYKSNLVHKALGTAVDDQLNFAYLVPEEVENYSFYQYAYLQYQDSIYAKGVMSEWVDKGIVKGILDGESFVITDYRVQQNPILILLERSEEVDTNYLINEVKHFEGFQLTQDFPDKGSSIYLLELEDKVVIAESEEMCRKLALHYKLGKTLALNAAKQRQVYGDLTREVHFRNVGSKKATAVSFSDVQSFKVEKIEGDLELPASMKSNNVKTVALSKSLKDVLPIWDHIRGDYSYFVSNQEGDYSLISKKGDLIWQGKIEDEIKDLKVVDVYQNKKHQVAFTTTKAFYILDLNGNLVNGFPVQFEDTLTANFAAVSWRGQSKFIFGTEAGEVIMLNAKGMELVIQKIAKEAIIGQVHGLNRKGVLSAWIRTRQQAYCVELEKTKLKRKTDNFSINQIKSGGDVISAIKENEAMNLKNIAGETVGNILGTKTWKDEKYFYDLKDGVIRAYSPYGDELIRINKSNQEITEIHSIEIKGKYYTLILDELENNIYLFDNEGDLVKGWPKEGEGVLSFVYNKNSKELSVLSKVEQNLIIYSIFVN